MCSVCDGQSINWKSALVQPGHSVQFVGRATAGAAAAAAAAGETAAAGLTAVVGSGAVAMWVAGTGHDRRVESDRRRM